MCLEQTNTQQQCETSAGIVVLIGPWALARARAPLGTCGSVGTKRKSKTLDRGPTINDLVSAANPGTSKTRGVRVGSPPIASLASCVDRTRDCEGRNGRRQKKA